MNTITPLTSATNLGSATSRSSGQPHWQKYLQSGETLKATVMEAKGKDIFILDIGGSSIAAQSKASLSPGQVLQLQLVSTSPQIELKIVTNTLQQFSSRSLTLIGENVDLTALFKTLQQTGETSPLDGLTPITQQTLENFFSLQHSELSGKDGGEVLKHLIDKLGLSLENLLANGDKENAVKTLKAALLEIAHVFKGATEIGDTTHRILGTLEVFQMAQLHLEDTANFIFPLPLPFLKNGYLTVENPVQQKEDAESGIHSPFRFSLHLTMAELGNIRVDFLQYQDGLYIRFNTDSKEKADFVESFSADLKQAISSIPLLGLSFSETAADPTAELIQKLLPQGSSMLDTKI
jgi:hypothetical protein